MHSAPSVSYPVGRSRLAGFLFLTLWVMGAGVVLAWWYQAPAHAVVRVFVLSAWLVAGIAAWRAWSRNLVQAVAWDGQYWSTTGPSDAHVFRMAGAVVHLDFQVLILVRFVEAGRPALWLWLERQAMPAYWRALRRALHGRVPRAQTLPSSTERAGLP